MSMEGVGAGCRASIACSYVFGLPEVCLFLRGPRLGSGNPGITVCKPAMLLASMRAKESCC